MKSRLLFSAGIALLLGVPGYMAPMGRCLEAHPEAEGISSQAIVDFVEAAGKIINTFDSFMIVRHGEVVAESWWKPNFADEPHILNS